MEQVHRKAMVHNGLNLGNNDVVMRDLHVSEVILDLARVMTDKDMWDRDVCERGLHLVQLTHGPTRMG